MAGEEEAGSGEFGAGSEGVGGEGVTREERFTEQPHQLSPALVKLGKTIEKQNSSANSDTLSALENCTKEKK